MTDLKLPPRRTLPPATKERIRRVVDTGISVTPTRRMPLVAAAAVVAVIALGAVLLMRPDHEPDHRPAATPPATSVQEEPAPLLTDAEMSAVLDRCAAAMPGLGPRAAWQPAMGVREYGISVVGARIADKPVICQTTAWSVTVSDPAHRPAYLGDSGTAVLLDTPELVLAGVADETWPRVGLKPEAPGTLISTYTKAGFFVRLDPGPRPTAGLRAYRTDRPFDWEDAMDSQPITLPPPPLVMVDRPGVPADGDQALLDQCLTARTSPDDYGWAPAAGAAWYGDRVLLARVGDKLGLCRYTSRPADDEKKYEFTELPPAPAATGLCRIPYVMPEGAVFPSIVGTVRQDAAYLEITFESGLRHRIQVVRGTFVALPLDTDQFEEFAAYDRHGTLLTEGLPANC